MSATRSPDSPEFHIIVRRPNRKGPLAPYRFAIVIVFALAVSGIPLLDATETGRDIDLALGRTALSALFAWLVVGRINKILASADLPRDSDGSADAETHRAA